MASAFLVALAFLGSATLSSTVHAAVPAGPGMTSPAAYSVSAAQEPASPPAESHVSSIPSGETDRFVDTSLIGRSEAEFRDRWIVFVTDVHPEGIWARIRTFDAATGTITLYAPIAAGSVKSNDIYWFGDDVIDNDDTILEQSTLLKRPPIELPQSIPDVPQAWNAATNLSPEAVAIDTGAGADSITNSGVVTAAADALMPSIVIPGTQQWLSDTDASTNATAVATGIHSGIDRDRISNDGNVSATASATAFGVGVSINAAPGEDGKGTSTLKGDINASSEATAVSGGDGSDTIANTAALAASATTTTARVDVGVIGAKGDTAVSASTKADSRASAINGGAAGDAITNSGAITATGTSTAAGLDVAVGKAEGKDNKVKTAVQGGTTATALVTAIDTDGSGTSKDWDVDLVNDASGIGVRYQDWQTRDSGDDTLTNSGSVAATASATTVGLGVGVTVDGEAAAASVARADASATGIDLGGGDDQLTNTGQLTADASAIGVALNVAVGVASGTSDAKAAADGSVVAASNATGISADSRETDTSHVLSAVVGSNGLTIVAREGTTHASGDDTVINAGVIGATAAATTVGAGIGVSVGAKANAKTTSTADAIATGVDLGAGNDVLTNSGQVVSGADATAVSLNAAVGVTSGSESKSKSTSTADGSATAISRATGLAADGGPADTSRTATLTIGDDGLSVAYASAATRSSGDDRVTNTGAISADAVATTVAVGAGITVKGAASANSTSVTEASAVAVDLGAGQDTLDNSGTLSAEADSNAVGFKAAISTDGRATSSDGMWKGGVKSEAQSTGVDAVGAGDRTSSAAVTLDLTGIRARYETTRGSVDTGLDVITNSGTITSDATANAIAANVAVTADGIAAAVSHVEAEAGAAGIRTGNGDDTIRNLGPGTTTVNADALAVGAKVAISGKGAAVAGDALWDGAIKANADATGIDSDSGRTDSTLITGAIDASGVQLMRQAATSGASGNDLIENTQTITVDAGAIAPSVNVAIEAKKGLAAVVSKVTTDATAAAIRSGGGADNITNRGELSSTATSTAVAANIAIAKDGAAVATSSVWDGGTTANASATGIDADGGPANRITTTTLTVNGSGASILHSTVTDQAQGNDVILNTGKVTADATATAPSVDVGLTIANGLSAALSKATTQATAEAIRGGGGNDTITNSGLLTSDADATSVAVTVAVTVDKGAAVAANAVWDGGITADAVATGINADGGDGHSSSTLTITTSGGGDIDKQSSSTPAAGNDTVINSGAIEATADAITPQVGVAVAVKGVSAAISTSTARANATAIDGGAGDDSLANSAQLHADSGAVAVAVNAAVGDKGIAAAANDVWDGGVDAAAVARGLNSGTGTDTVVNDGAITAESSATAPSVAVAVVATGIPVAVSTATANAAATAIDGGVGNDTITNLNNGVGHTGKLVADANAVAVTANVAVTNTGIAAAADAVWDGGTTAQATATGIDAGAGTDVITNTAAIDALANSVPVSVGVSVAVTGVAAASATSNATSSTAAIDSGLDADMVTNSGALLADAETVAVGASVTFTNTGVAVGTDSVWDGGTTATSTARGITTGGGDDLLANDGAVTTDADATTVSGTVSVSVNGLAGAVSSSTALTNSTAIDTGVGNDTINNARTNAGRTGALTATADSVAVAASVSVAVYGVAVSADSVWDGGTTAEAVAGGINAGLGSDTVTNSSATAATANSTTVSAGIGVGVFGVAGAVVNATGDSTATAIDAGADDSADTVTNTAAIAATADTNAVSAGVSFSVAGLAVSGDSAWNGGTTGTTAATGIATGGGSDSIVNRGLVTTVSDADAVSASVGVTVFGVAGGISTVTAQANSTGLDGGGGNDTIENTSTGTLQVSSDANGVAVNVTATGIGISASADSVWDTGTKAAANSRGISGGAGLDTITNDALINAGATSSTTSVSVSLTGTGASLSAATSTSTADATAIDGGDDADAVTNRHDVIAGADATGTGVAVTVTGLGAGAATDAFWNSGTTANAIATGLAGGGGGDTITNDHATVAANAISDTTSVAVSVTALGLAGGAADTTSTARATAIDGGAGTDQIVNDATLAPNATSTASGVSVTFTLAGASASGPLVDNKTTAAALATGIAGGSEADQVTATDTSSIQLHASAEAKDIAVGVTVAGVSLTDSNALSLASGTGIHGGDGNDTLTNAGAIAAAGALGSTPAAINATSNARAITVSIAGDAEGTATGTAEADAVGIDGGNDNDIVLNTGTISLSPAASAVGQSIGVAIGGATVTDARGVAASSVVGLEGGAGSDQVTNQGSIALTPIVGATGRTFNITVAGAAIGDASAQSDAWAAGIDGGSGDDVVTNRDSINASVRSTTTAKSTGFVLAGSNVGTSNTLSSATSIGLEGGMGSDTVSNSAAGTVDVSAGATTVAESAIITAFGAASSDAMTAPTSTAIGLDGGADNDTVSNSGTVHAVSTASARSTSSSTSVFDSASSSAGTTANALAFGATGGDGSDLVLNRSVMTSDAGASAVVDSSSWVLGGGAGDKSSLYALGLAVGLAGGGKADVVRNEGNVRATSDSSLRAVGGSSAVFGNARSGTQLFGRAEAVGLAGDAGADEVTNDLTVEAAATALVTATKVTVTFAGGATTAALLVGRADARGIDGGADADTLRNNGTLQVTANGLARSSVGAKTTFGATAASAIISSEATATGMLGGDGANVVTNGGLITVESSSDAQVTHSADSGYLYGDAETRADVVSAAIASGLTADAGTSTLTNNGSVTVQATGLGFGLSYADAAHWTFDADGTAVAASSASAVATGFGVGDGNNLITNNGPMHVTALAKTSKPLELTFGKVCSQERPVQRVCEETTDEDGNTIEVCRDVLLPPVTTCEARTIQLGVTPTNAVANGNGLDGDGSARATAEGYARAFGVQAGNGSNRIQNSGALTVTAQPQPSAAVFADGDAWGNATGYTSASALARATGILTGNGGNVVQNDGTITVTAAPLATARTEVSGGDICIWYLFGTWCGGGGSGYGTAYTTYAAEAIGIRTGTGDDTVVNNGTLVVTAAPDSGATTATIVGANSAVSGNTIHSSAVGVQTGGGSDAVLNGGLIAVRANDLPGCAPGVCATDVTATGVDTGDGNDVIVNHGTLSATTNTGGTVRNGIAINAGAGNDIVEVGTGSTTAGSIILGTGDDTFVWGANATITGNPDAGPGIDTFALGGTGTASFTLTDLAARFPGFERNGKVGTSTWTLVGDAHVDWSVSEGTLVVPGTMTGTFTTNGTGELSVPSTGTIQSDDGAPAVVLAGGLVRSDGVIHSDRVSVEMGQGATLQNTGTIFGNLIGIRTGSADAVVENSGTVLAGGSAVVLGGERNVFANSGSVQGATTGLEISGDANTLLSGGTIQGSAAGIVITGNANQVANDGLIESSGIALNTTGSGNIIENTGTVQTSGRPVVLGGRVNTLFNSGLIAATGGNPAVEVTGLSNLVFNAGVMHSTGTTVDISGTGNALTNSGAIDSLTTGVLIAGTGNSMVNTGLVHAAGTGLDVHGGGSQVTNAGAIESDGIGVMLRGDASSFLNSGSLETTAGALALQVTGAANNVTNAGLIHSETTGVDFRGSLNVLSNVGTLAAQGTAVSMSGDRNTIVNDGTIVSGGSTGVQLSGNAITFTNRGLVDAVGPAVWLQSAAGSSLYLQNEASGLLQSMTGAAILGGAGSEHVVNAGWLVGGAGTAIDLADGNDTLTLATTAAIQGLSHGGSGVDSLVLAGTGRARANLGSFTGFENLSKEDASRWFVSGSSDMSWRVRAGELSVDGALTGRGIVERSGRLSGNGTVGSFTNEGTVAPGASIGTLTGTGDYAHAPGAVLEIEGTPMSGLSDHLNVAGRAVLDGGRVSVMSADTQYGIATEYSILRAAGGVEGTFAGTVSNAANLDATLEYARDEVSLMLIRNDISFQAMGNGENVQAFGTAMDASKRAMAWGDFKELMDGFVVMDAGAQQSALATLTGEVHATVARSLVHTGMRFVSAEMNRQVSARQVRSGNGAFWGDAFGFNGSVESDGNASKASYRAAGFATGFDVMPTDATRFGIGFGISPGRTELQRANGGVATTRSYHPSIYGEHDAGSWDFGGGLGYSRHQVDTSRHVQVASITRVATSNYDADQYSGLLRGAFQVARVHDASFRAFSEMRYSRLTRSGFVEEGAASANLANVSGARLDSLEFLLGVRTRWSSESTRRVRPDLKVGWAHESMDDRGGLTAALAGATVGSAFHTFSIFGPTESRNSAIVNLGLSIGVGTNGDAFFSYDGRASGSGSEHGFAAGGRLNW